MYPTLTTAYLGQMLLDDEVFIDAVVLLERLLAPNDMPSPNHYWQSCSQLVVSRQGGTQWGRVFDEDGAVVVPDVITSGVQTTL